MREGRVRGPCDGPANALKRLNLKNKLLRWQLGLALAATLNC